MSTEIEERRVVCQDWYETEYSNVGWESNCGWFFRDDYNIMNHSWEVLEILDSDKFGHPVLGVATRKITI